MQALVDKKPALGGIPRAQRWALAKSLADFERRHPRNQAIALAYLSGQHTMAAIAEHFGMRYTTVGRIVSAYEQLPDK